MGGVKLLRSEKLGFAILPSSFKHLNVEKGLELGGDVLEKRENPVNGMFIAEGVEDKAIFGHERVSVSRNPISRCRFNTPRKK